MHTCVCQRVRQGDSFIKRRFSPKMTVLKGKGKYLLLQLILKGTWVAQWVKRLTLDFGSGHDVESSPVSGSALTAWGLLGILPLLPSLCPFLSLLPSLCLSLSK